MVKINRQICDLCGACLAVCPQSCMEIIHFTLKIDNSICIKCGKCIDVCPLEALEMSDDD
ncbi:MAG: 4Fe-4S dicluster domain-containing protein [Fidelibacterota bacterium]